MPAGFQRRISSSEARRAAGRRRRPAPRGCAARSAACTGPRSRGRRSRRGAVMPVPPARRRARRPRQGRRKDGAGPTAEEGGRRDEERRDERSRRVPRAASRSPTKTRIAPAIRKRHGEGRRRKRGGRPGARVSGRRPKSAVSARATHEDEEKRDDVGGRKKRSDCSRKRTSGVARAAGCPPIASKKGYVPKPGILAAVSQTERGARRGGTPKGGGGRLPEERHARRHSKPPVGAEPVLSFAQVSLRKSTKIWLAILAGSAAVVLAIDGEPDASGCSPCSPRSRWSPRASCSCLPGHPAAFRAIVRRLDAAARVLLFPDRDRADPAAGPPPRLTGYLLAYQFVASRLRREVIAVAEEMAARTGPASVVALRGREGLGSPVHGSRRGGGRALGRPRRTPVRCRRG